MFWKLNVCLPIQRHWQGRYPLWQGFWFGLVSLFVIAWAMNTLTWALQDALLGIYESSYVVIFSAAAFYLVFIPIFCWWAVGVWRSATRQSNEQEVKRRATNLAKVLVCLITIAEVAKIAIEVRPQIVDAISNIEEDPQQGARGVKITSNGSQIEIFGYLTRSLVPEFEQALKAHPTITLVSLSSEGGRVNSARKIKEIIRAHGLSTLVVQECSSACVVVFLGGSRRWVSDNALIGFHAASFGGRVSEISTKLLRNEAISEGVSPKFAERAYSNHLTLWYPSIAELINAHVATGVWPAQKSNL